MRRGGASALFMETGDFGVVASRGRWQSTTTAKIYVEECVEAVLDMRLTASQRNRVHMWRDSALKIFN